MTYKSRNGIATNRRIIELYNMMETGELILDPDFQRRLVWNDKHKENFLDTILKGFPFPEVYFTNGKLDPDTMETQTLVVDGQQRLSTIRQYIGGDENLKLKTIKPYQILTKEEKENFCQYIVIVRDLNNMEKDEILEVFKRINSVQYALNAMEIHNALYEGDFIRLAKEIAENPILEDLNFLNKNDYSRMKDLEFIILIMTTVELGAYFTNDREVKEMIKMYDNEYPQSKKMENAFLDVLKLVKKLQMPADSIWYTKSGMFTLLCELMFKAYKNKELPTAESLETILDSLNNDVRAEKEGFEDFYKYLYQATASKSGREIRGKILRKEL